MGSAVSPPTVAIVVKKRNPMVTLGRPQKWYWTALNWDNRRKLATSGERFTNRDDTLANAVQLFADASVDPVLLEQAHVGTFWQPANVYLVQDGISGMQALRVQRPTAA